MKKTLGLLIAILISTAIKAQDNQKIQLANEYYLQGETEKALDLYDDLAKDLNAIPLIHTNYFSLLLDTKDYKNCSRYIQRLIKAFPTNLYYQIDNGILLQEQELSKEANAQFLSVITSAQDDQYKLRIVAQYFINKQLYTYAKQTYLIARETSKQPASYALELANLYRMMNDKTMMVEEYLNFASSNPNNLNYVKNILQSLLVEESDLQNLEDVLIIKAQAKPNETIYPELLIWVNLQRKDFYGAFLQARALERRQQGDGGKLMDIGMIALENQAYEDATKIFAYITTNYTTSIHYVVARKLMINAREGLIKNVFPINYDEIRKLVNDYQQMVNDLGLNNTTLEALRNKALLHAFYLDEKDVAIEILQQIISTPRINRDLQSNCKIDMGDIYILLGQPWESTLLYSQVEKAQKETPIGYLAKLKNAKLNYYKGDFELAKGHLDILKLATSREISNDAIALGILISDNTAMDTSDYVMKKFAAIELMLFQNKYEESIAAFKKMLKDYPKHSLTDEIWWNLANIHLKLGQFEESVSYLEKITTEYKYDILSDDAHFLMANIYEVQLGDKEKAKDLYQEFLKAYPGSKFVAEARLRFRKLRGDYIN